MKVTKRLLPFLLCILVVLGVSCSGQQKNKLENVIMNELDLLKNLDSETTQKYISYKELFPDAADNTEFTEQVQEVFSLFFKDFDYKILNIDVDRKNNSATAKLKLSTLDARSLAKDYARSMLEYIILTASESETESTNDISPSLEARYLLLNQQLTQHQYKTVESDCTMQLLRDNNSPDTWEIKRTHSLENDLIGGLMTFLSESDLVSPEETLDIYLQTLSTMDVEHMGNFLGITSLLLSEDISKQKIASALVELVHKHFKYEITDSKIMDGYHAEVRANITTFDSNAILAAYQNAFDEYLASTEAVIDGSKIRIEKSYNTLLSVLENNEAISTSEVTFHFTNDGISWKLSDQNEELGNAIFGILTTTPVSDTDS